MKNFDLNGLGVQEMNAEEMRETDGGNVLLFLVILTVVTYVMAILVEMAD